MRIGIDCRFWNETGVGRYIRNLVSNLAQIDKQNDYVLFVKSENINNVRLITHNSRFIIKTTDISWHGIEEQIRLPGILNSQNLDLVHFPYFSVPIFYNKPFIVTIHDLIQWHFSTGKASTLPYPFYMVKFFGYKFVIKSAAQKAKRIITVSNATKEEIVDHLKIPSEKIEVVHEGVDPQITNSKLQIQNKFQNTKYKIHNASYFLYVGNAYPHKNLEKLIEAFKNLKSQISNLKTTDQSLKLVLIGRQDYFYKRLKEKVSRMKIAGSIEFYEEASDKELRVLYENARVLIIPSLMEGFGLPALEAMANKCLVLASNTPAIKEVCGEDALYFNPYDINDISEKLKVVYEGKFDKKIIEKGFKRSKEFSWHKTSEETLRIYEQTIS